MNLPTVRPTLDNRYLLVEPFRVDQTFVVPAGYQTNGANIPRLFWWLIPPFKPKYLPAIIVHDFLCDKERYKEADDLFEQMLFAIETSWRTRLMVKAVRLYHRVRYGTQ